MVFVPAHLGRGQGAAEADRGVALRLFVVPGYDRCNYRCPYCITGTDHSARQHWDPEPYLRLLRRLAALEASLESVVLGVGGEPLTSREILDSVRTLAESTNVGAVNFVTNLSWSADRLRGWVSGLPAEKLAMACTYHPSEAGDLTEFLSKVAMLRELGVSVSAGCVAWPPNLALVAEVRRHCDEMGLPLFVNGLFGEYGGRSYPHDYTDEERAFLRQVVYSEHDYEYLFVPCRTKGKLCSAGCSAAMMAPNGDYYRCSHEYRAGTAPLGNLHRDEGLRLFGEYLPCPAEHCFCTAETTNTLEFEEQYVRTRHFRVYHPRPLGADCREPERGA